MRVIIPCAGDGTRWGNFQDVPKHLAVLRGEPLLHRTVRLVRGLVPDADVVVVTRDMRDRRELVDGARRSRAKLDPTRGPADKLLSSAHLWPRSGRTAVLFGDVYWTEKALGRLLLVDDRPWVAAARFGPSSFTGCGHAELFGFAFDPTGGEVLAEAAVRLVAAAAEGRITSWSGGWQIYQVAAGVPVDDVVRGTAATMPDLGCSVPVDDWTDDLDAPDDWHRWCWHWARADEATRRVGHEGEL